MPSFVTVARALMNPSINRIATSGDFLNPDWLEHLLCAASERVASYTHRPVFDVGLWTERKTSLNSTQAFLSMTPIHGITSLEIEENDGTTTTVLGNQFRWDFNSGQVRYLPQATGQAFPNSQYDYWYDEVSGVYQYPTGSWMNTVWTYTGGYLEVPEAVQEATIQIALAMAAQSSTSNDTALGAESAGDYRSGFRQETSKFGLFTMEVRNLLEPYRLMDVGTIGLLGNVVGMPGPQGIVTFYGPQGPQGAAGNQGFMGIVGIQGFIGDQGTQGWMGVQGRQGRFGIQGAQGNQGIMGIQGWQGWQGYQGKFGNQGWQGCQGHQGSQGWTGTGVQGAQGSEGYQGSQGYQGPT